MLVQLALVTGCRRGELVALQWSDIDFVHRTVHIMKSNYKLKKQPIFTKTPKTRESIRSITIPNFCISLLKKWRCEQTLQIPAVINTNNIGNWVFTQKNGNPMHPCTPTYWFNKFLKRSGLLHRTFHALRHTSGTLLTTNGISVKSVGLRLGHAKLSTTNRYLHKVNTDNIKESQVFDTILFQENRI